MTGKARQPALYIPHGGGPCFFMPDPQGVWSGMGRHLASMPSLLPQPPRAILLVTSHWETAGFAVTGGERPGLIYDYYGFPPHTYELTYPAPGAPDLARRVADLMQAAALSARVDSEHGWDHGVFVPLKVAFPDADIPVVALSLDQGLDPALHLAAGKALAPLRDDNVLIIGSGMSYHNLRAMGDPRAAAHSDRFDAWLQQAMAQSGPDRAAALRDWHKAPSACESHPREEHLLPLMVVAGTSPLPGQTIYNERIGPAIISGFRFD